MRRGGYLCLRFRHLFELHVAAEPTHDGRAVRLGRRCGLRALVSLTAEGGREGALLKLLGLALPVRVRRGSRYASSLRVRNLLVLSASTGGLGALQ